jgi:hypothetical protein
MSFTQLNYPAAFASEGNPLAHGAFPGDYNPYVHGINDTMDINDATGIFSIDVGFIPYFLEQLLTQGSTWRDSRSWQLPLLWSRRDGTMPGGNIILSFLNMWSYEFRQLSDLTACEI